jgi:hypothetical protein
MAKLFAGNEPSQSPVESFEEHRFSSVEVESYRDAIDSIDTLSKLFRKEEISIDVVKQLKYSTERLELTHNRDIKVAEANLKVFDIIQGGMDARKIAMPSMEDFGSQFTREASVQVSMEGFTDFIKRIWKIIKDFVISFWKKIALFFKRITGGRLNNDEIKAYIKKNLDRIRVNDMKVPLDSGVMIPTRLPKIFGDISAEKFTIKDLEYIAAVKINSHIQYMKTIEQYYRKQVEVSERSFREVKKFFTLMLATLVEQHGIIEKDIDTIVKSDEEPSSGEAAALTSADEDLTNLCATLGTLGGQQLTLVIESFGLIAADAAEIPQEMLATLDGMKVNSTSMQASSYYKYGRPENLLSNFSIFYKSVVGNQVLTDAEGLEKTVAVRDTKIVCGARECSGLQDELAVMDKYAVLAEMFEKAKELERVPLGETLGFVNKVEQLVTRHVKEIQEALEKTDLFEKYEKLKQICQANPDKLSKKLEALEKLLYFLSALSDALTRSGHIELMDITREVTGKLAAINAGTASELYNYIYKCSKEFK